VLQGTLRFAGTGSGSASLEIGNGATFEMPVGATLSIAGSVTNYGTLRFTGGNMLGASGSFANHGVVDVVIGGSLPVNFVNYGTVLERSSVAVDEVGISDGNVVVSISSLPGHNYQIQQKANLSAASWTNVGEAQPGTGGPLSLIDLGGASDPSRFYRVLLSP